MVAIGSSPPYAVKFLPVKSKGVEAPILMGPELTAPSPCMARLFSLSSRLLFTFWVAPENKFAKRQLRFSTCSNAGFSGSPNGCPRSSPHGRPDPVHRPGSINDLPIKESERNYHWLGRRPDEHPGVTDLGLCNPQCALLAYALCLRAQGPPGWHWLASVAIGLFQALAQAEQKELFMSNPAFYRMIRTENRTLEIGFLDRGMQAFSLTFG